MGLTTSTSNSKKCEECEGFQEDHFSRTQVARDAHYRYARTRGNRSRISTGGYPETWIKRIEAAGLTSMLGKLVCDECCWKFYAAINKGDV